MRYSRWRYKRARRGKPNCGECLRPVTGGGAWCREHATPEAALRREQQRARWSTEEVRSPEWAA